METAVQTTVPEILVYEWVEGQPVYYKGYQQVVNGKKQPEEIMGSRYLQSLIISRLVKLLFAHIDPQRYEVLFSEVGLQLGKGKERSLDIGIFQKGKLKGIAKEKYVQVAPELVIEVDIKAEGEDMSYLSKKTEELLEFGAHKIIWILTKPEKILIAERSQEQWEIVNWHTRISLLEGMEVNIKEIIAQP